MIKAMRLPEKHCPECGRLIDWKVFHKMGAPTSSGFCKKCCIVFKNREAPEITEGKKLEKSGITKDKSWKEIAHYPCDVQIGILRKRQHPDGEIL